VNASTSDADERSLHRYRPIASLASIASELDCIKTALEKLRLTVAVPVGRDGDDVKLVVSNATSQVKVEVNQVFRGNLFPMDQWRLVDAAEHLFTTRVTLPVLATAELYGSKLVAAFDRQHPRDWFDVLHMRSRQALTSDVIDCFIAYLAGHNRPVHEVLFPKLQPMQAMYEAEFAGMTRDAAAFAEIDAIRSATLAELPTQLSDNQREFLLSLVRAQPRWELMPFKHLAELPAVRWKLQNLERLRTRNKNKFVAQHDELHARLSAASAASAGGRRSTARE
jgi:hypothetical protein